MITSKSYVYSYICCPSRSLACACHDRDGYPIIIYNVRTNLKVSINIHKTLEIKCNALTNCFPIFKYKLFHIALVNQLLIPNLQIPEGTMKGQMLGHYGLIYDLHWSRDSKLLLSASSDGTAR